MGTPNPLWEPALPYDLVEGNESHGPYVTTAFGTTVCDFYAMSNPSSPSVRNGGASKPIWFTDAAENAAFMVMAANAYHDILADYSNAVKAQDDLLAGLRTIIQKLEFEQPNEALKRARSLLAKHGGA
ncbi:hypothetical protein [Rhizobium leucaenae]|uniref:hypothetical protein n=1 Tax=Rhizobium leucaenae TaxID=29450 RepID=UPI00160D3D7B|nr:hypothetical protein [Rhizobium leucaenae]MBB6299959.1 hypothetical protein [Rhizobium leucaenae]